VLMSLFFGIDIEVSGVVVATAVPDEKLEL
jgi:hypothetical protein